MHRPPRVAPLDLPVSMLLESTYQIRSCSCAFGIWELVEDSLSYFGWNVVAVALPSVAVFFWTKLSDFASSGA